MHNVIARALDEFGQVDILVNNAGIMNAKDFLEITEDEFENVLSVNLKGAFLCSQAIAHHMIDQIEDGKRPGCIINMAAMDEMVKIDHQVPYSISKNGVMQLTKIAAKSLAKYGIRVNAIGPGGIVTSILGSLEDNEDAPASHSD